MPKNNPNYLNNQIPLFNDDGTPYKEGDKPKSNPLNQKSPWGVNSEGIPLTKSGAVDKRTKEYKAWKAEKDRADKIRENRQKGSKKGWETRRTNILNKQKYNKKLGIFAGVVGAVGLGAGVMSAQRSGIVDQGGLFSPGTTRDDVRNASWWDRQKSIMAAGHLDPNTTALGAMGSYGLGRLQDRMGVIFNSPLSQSGISPGAAAGATIGGTLSLTAATALGGYRKFKGKGKFGMIGALGAGLSGALFGGYQGSKVDIGFSRALQTARKNVLSSGSRRLSNRTHTMGRGFRSWASPRGVRRMGQGGHLGMDGSMAFAMHNARHRSTL